ncbi:hypothetical protein ACP4OV_002401 [Aristida adscensionis]
MGNSSSSSAAASAGDGGTSTTISAVTATGWHVLKVRDYSHTSKGMLGNGEFISSVPFTVGGHTWCMRYFPDGYNYTYANWISVDLCLRRAAASSKDGTVKARCKFSLLGPDGNPDPTYVYESRETRTFSAAHPAQGSYDFIKRTVLESETSNYIRDDGFSIRCDVTVTNGVHASVTKKPLVKVPPSNLGRELGALLLTGEGADVIFQVGDVLFKAHRIVLAARSSVFKAELFGPMREKVAAHVRIEDMEPKVFKAMLRFIYSDSLPSMAKGEETVMFQHLLDAADRYDLKRLKLICEDKLCRRIDKDTVISTMVLAGQHGCQELKEACLAFLESPDNLKAVMATNGFDHLAKLAPDVSGRNQIKRLSWCFPVKL